MVRTTRRALLALLALIVFVAVAGGVYAWQVRPDLDSRRDAATEAWDALRPALDERYLVLTAATDTVREEGGRPRAVVRDLDVALATWRDAREAGDDVIGEVRIANDLEGLTRRLVRTVTDTPRLASNEAVTAVMEQLASTPVPAAAADYADAVRAYESERQGTVRELFAELLGFDSLPTLDPSAS
ncbi:MAG TPA: LemA family protein [Acidimicrobiia bacterium]|nr:LemA family protein [Acidimicrobiia bacterium]